MISARLPITPRIRFACALISSDAFADSSALAAVSWTTRSICPTALLIFSMPLACSLLASAISHIMPANFCTLTATSRY